MSYPPPLQAVVDELGRFPGVGPKSAQRIAFWLMRQPNEDVARLAQSLDEMKTKLSFCERCCNIAETGGLCPDLRRRSPRSDRRSASSRTRPTSSRWSVPARSTGPTTCCTVSSIHSKASPPTDLRIQELILRLRGPVKEVILCFNSNVEGDATAMYLSRLLQVPGLVVSQPASGLPVGGDLEFADDLTLGRAIDGRRVLND